jgi:hypothetical protein
VEAQFGRPDAYALDRVNELLDQHTGVGRKDPAE